MVIQQGDVRREGLKVVCFCFIYKIWVLLPPPAPPNKSTVTYRTLESRQFSHRPPGHVQLQLESKTKAIKHMWHTLNIAHAFSAPLTDSYKHALLVAVTDRAPGGVCSLQLWPWARTRLCWLVQKEGLPHSILSLPLLTCPTCLQSTVALSFGPHRRALRGCGRDSHIQRATEKQGRQIGTRDVLRRQLCWFVRPLTANISGKIGG